MSLENVINTDDFRCERKPPCATTKSTLFAVSQDEWHTKEDNPLRMPCVYHDMPKGISWAKAMSNGEEPLLSYTDLKVSGS